MRKRGANNRSNCTEPGWDELDQAVSELEGSFPWANAYWKQIINRGTERLVSDIESYLEGHAAFEAWCRANGRE